MDAAADNLRITADFTLRLCALLRRAGVQIGTQQTIACMQAILILGSVHEEELRAIYRITLINRKQDLWTLHTTYDVLLKDYLSPRLADDDTPEKKGPAVVVKRRQYTDDKSSSEAGDEATQTEGYSVREVDHQKDFRFIQQHHIPDAMAELNKIAKKHASIARRKSKRSKHHGSIDLRNSVRESVRFDGEIVNWRFKRKRRTLSRFVIVSDVSGSMEIYSIFLLNFLHLLNSSRRMKMETFVFSTRLERLTKQFRSKSFPEMLKNVAQHFSSWSGGTKIGGALEVLNETYGSVLTAKTVVIIMSDGWDTGDILLLEREMMKLRGRTKSIVWINPLKGAPLYEPLAAGMAAARPFCDYFVTGHSLESLGHLAGVLSESESIERAAGRRARA